MRNYREELSFDEGASMLECESENEFAVIIIRDNKGLELYRAFIKILSFPK